MVFTSQKLDGKIPLQGRIIPIFLMFFERFKNFSTK